MTPSARHPPAAHEASRATQYPLPHNVPWLALLSHTLQATETYFHGKNRSIFGIVAGVAQAPPVTLPMGCFAVGSVVVGQHPSVSIGTSSMKVGSGCSRTTTVLEKMGSGAEKLGR